MPEIFLAKSARPDEAHSHRTGAGLPAVPPSGPRGGSAGVSGSHVARPAQCLFRTRSHPDRHGGLRGAPERNGSAGRRIDRHDHADVGGRAADRHRRAVLEREDERQLEPQVRRRTSPQTIPAAAPADLCPEHQPRVRRALESRRTRFPIHQSSHDTHERAAGAVEDVFASRGGGRSNRGAFGLGRGTERVRRGLDRRCPASRERQFARLVHPVHPRPDPGDRADGRRHVEA